MTIKRNVIVRLYILELNNLDSSNISLSAYNPVSAWNSPPIVDRLLDE